MTDAGPDFFLGRSRMMLNQYREYRDDDERFRAFFGVGPVVCALLWRSCTFHPNTQPIYLLWGLMFMKTYTTQAVMSAIAKTTRKTFRKWAWQVIYSISDHANVVISWQNRFRNDVGKTCLVTVDGTDFKIQQQFPFSDKWFCYKFRGPGLRYEVVVCIQTGDIVWIYGPFLPGRYNDLMIFKRMLLHMLSPGEKVEADGVYPGLPHAIGMPCDYVSVSDKRAKDAA